MRLKAYDTSADLVLTAVRDARDGVIEWVALLGAGGTAALPFAWRRDPNKKNTV
jgi:hypothetical protein